MAEHAGRNTSGQGAPRGKPISTAQAVQAMLECEALRITQRLIDGALAGETQAVRMILDRVAPAPKDRAVPFNMPDIKAPADAPLIISALLKAVAVGDLAPSEAEAVAKLVEFYRRSVETANIEVRLKLVEEAHAKA